MEQLLTAESLAALFTLTVLEIVLGIDNIVILAILSNRLKEEQRDKARKIGLFLAMFMRITLLLSISWIMSLTVTLFSVVGQAFTGRDLVLIIGGFFLLYKATTEIYTKSEEEQDENQPPKNARFGGVIIQIVIMDMIFSLDSVITAVGMVKQVEGQTWQPLAIMITAVVIAVMIMLFFAGPIARVIERHPSIKILALAFLLMVGLVLIADGFHQHIPKGYVYVAMGFSVFVEFLNLQHKTRFAGK